jgi:predicted metal-dependent HD superfamily phosphohydrolase
MIEHLNLSSEEVVIADRLKSQWFNLVQKSGGNTNLIDSEFSKLLHAYISRGENSHHNLFHISDVDTFLNKYRQLAFDFTALKFAGDGHDSVYNPISHTNEEDSAKFMQNLLQVLNMPEETISEVKRIILLTKEHQTKDDDVDGKLMIDADFSILAVPEQKYDRYVQGIWQEYVGSGAVSEENFRKGRLKLVTGWLEKEKLFLTDEIRKELQPYAKRNLEKELAKLKSL